MKFWQSVAFSDPDDLLDVARIAEEWAGRPLQMEYFNDFTAGEEFYRKLEALRGSTDQKDGVAPPGFQEAVQVVLQGPFARRKPRVGEGRG